MKTAQLTIRTLVVCFVVLTLIGCTGRITLNAELDMGGKAGRRPLAKYNVYLLSDSIKSPEMEEAFRKYMSATTRPVKFDVPLEEKNIRTRAGFMLSEGKAIWQRYLIERAETNLQGKVKFRTTLKPGDYWIYCIVQRDTGWLLWNVKAPVEFYERTHVTLNEQNILQ